MKYISIDDQLSFIEVGKLAVIVVPNGNPLETDVMSIVRISVAKTMVGGKLIYEEGAR